MEAGKIKNTSLRLPNEIRKWLGHRAVENGRSINSEIMMIFKEMMKKEELENAGK
ncbi:Arc family DNA-binding protein [Aeromonas veronii]|uniref:Arc family DNA-binding protein n=1 Tax=Aeromonas veronii TaxID=654 RepID=UPI0030061D9C